MSGNTRSIRLLGNKDAPVTKRAQPKKTKQQNDSRTTRVRISLTGNESPVTSEPASGSKSIRKTNARPGKAQPQKSIRKVSILNLQAPKPQQKNLREEDSEDEQPQEDIQLIDVDQNE